MLVLDDLHSADQASLLLLEFLARELRESRLLVVGSYRDTEITRQHALTVTVARLSREPVFQRQVLRGSTQGDLRDLSVPTTGVQLPQELANAIYARTEGNPFFMTEVINLLSDSGELADGHPGRPEALRIPEGARGVIGQRLNRLSDQGNEVLTTASIIGRAFDFQLLLGLMSEITEDRLLQLVEEAASLNIREALRWLYPTSTAKYWEIRQLQRCLGRLKNPETGSTAS